MKARKTTRDNFAYLTIALMTFLLMASLVHQFAAGSVAVQLIEAALVLALGAGLWSFRAQHNLYRTTLLLVIGVLLVFVAGYVLDTRGLSLIHDGLLLVFFLLAAWTAARQVVFSGKVDGNAIVGVICVYLLLGMIWATLYLMVEEWMPGSFKGLAETGGPATYIELIYFSFISLTTMGYGDITPVSPLVRYLTYMEGIAGQFYIAILVATLVGVRVSEWQKEEG